MQKCAVWKNEIWKEITVIVLFVGYPDPLLFFPSHKFKLLKKTDYDDIYCYWKQVLQAILLYLGNLTSSEHMWEDQYSN